MFKKLDRPGEVHQDDAKNVIIIAGLWHINTYNQLLPILGFKTIAHSYANKARSVDHNKITNMPNLRCVKADSSFIKKYELPSYNTPELTKIWDRDYIDLDSFGSYRSM